MSDLGDCKARVPGAVRTIGTDVHFLVLSVALACGAATPAAASGPVADLRADADRDGRVSVRALARDDHDEEHWRRAHGAIVVANLDDDGRRCGPAPVSALSDESLAACNDAADDIVNGAADEQDLAPLRTVPWPDAPEGAAGLVELLGARAQGRLFVRRSGSWLSSQRAATLNARELRRGATLALEATDVVRDGLHWNGRLRIRLTVKAGGRTVADTVELQVAPIFIQPETLDAQRVVTAPSAESDRITWVERSRSAVSGAPLTPAERGEFEREMEQLAGASLWNYRELADLQRASQQKFLTELDGALASVGLSADRLETQGDIWAQDTFEPGFTSMPGRGGRPHVMRVLVRSANAMRSGDVMTQRGGGRAVFTQLRGPDVAAIQQLTPGRATLPFVGLGEDTVNSTGNFSATPPYRTKTRHFPQGRLVYGSAPGSRPDPAFVRMLLDQGVQPPIELDTAWLEVGHIDEFLAFLPAPTRRGWVAVVADPKYAYRLLREAERSQPTAAILESLQQISVAAFMPSTMSAERLVSEVLTDPDILQANVRASAAIERNLAVLRREMALTPKDVIRLPVLYGPLQLTLRGGVAALIPNGVNGLHARDGLFVAPRQHGPRVRGDDLFARAIEAKLRRVGIRVEWAETYYHATGAGVGGGEVHCITNALRDVRELAAWWERSHDATRR
jgi:protein-arginine deiminase